jgi:hypothetical protein
VIRLRRLGWLCLGAAACGGGAAQPDEPRADLGPTAGRRETGAPGSGAEEDLTGLAAPEQASTAGRPPVETWFVERTADWGLDFVHQAGALPEKHLPETMGAGAVLFDCDGDLDLDLYLIQGGPMRLGAGPGKFAEPPGELPPNRLYLNDGSGRFRDATATSGAAAHTGYGMGALSADFDRDGRADLFVTNLGADALFLGDGQGSFRDASQAAGIADPRWTSGALAFDADGDRDVDLYVAAYLEVDLDLPLWCGDRRPGWRSVCHPDAYAGLSDRFYRNRGDGTFEDATAAAGFDQDVGKGLGAMALDVEGDGDLDVFVANDSNGNRMWFNRGDGTFEDGTLISATGVDGYGRTEASMGLAFGDVDGDLLPEIFLTGFDDESDTLYQNLGGGRFRDATAQAGLEAPTRLPVGFGAALADFDHDADLDLVVANGHIIDNIALYHDGKTHAQRALVFANDGQGHFSQLSPEELRGLDEAMVGRGLYPGDLDGDGDLDLLVTQCGGPARLFENVRPTTAGFSIRGLPDGAAVRVRTADGRELVRWASAPVSYFGQGSPYLHLGLAPAEVVELTVFPPYGGAPRSIETEALVPDARRLVDLSGGW